LGVSDIDGHHMGRTTLQQAIRETTGRRARIESPQTCHIDGERRQSMIEFESAAPDESRRRTADHDLIARCDLARRLLGDRSVDEHSVFVDQGLCFGSTGGQPTSNELGVESSACAHAEQTDRPVRRPIVTEAALST
jgi:hypothetical protein